MQWRCAITLGQSEPGSNGKEGVLCISPSLASLEPHHQILWCHILDTRWGGVTPLQKYSRDILQPQPTGQDVEMGILVEIQLAAQIKIADSYMV